MFEKSLTEALNTVGSSSQDIELKLSLAVEAIEDARIFARGDRGAHYNDLFDALENARVYIDEAVELGSRQSP